MDPGNNKSLLERGLHKIAKRASGLSGRMAGPISRPARADSASNIFSHDNPMAVRRHSTVAQAAAPGQSAVSKEVLHQRVQASKAVNTPEGRFNAELSGLLKRENVATNTKYPAPFTHHSREALAAIHERVVESKEVNREKSNAAVAIEASNALDGRTGWRNGRVMPYVNAMLPGQGEAKKDFQAGRQMAANLKTDLDGVYTANADTQSAGQSRGTAEIGAAVARRVAATTSAVTIATTMTGNAVAASVVGGVGGAIETSAREYSARSHQAASKSLDKGAGSITDESLADSVRGEADFQHAMGQAERRKAITGIVKTTVAGSTGGYFLGTGYEVSAAGKIGAEAQGIAGRDGVSKQGRKIVGRAVEASVGEIEGVIADKMTDASVQRVSKGREHSSGPPDRSLGLGIGKAQKDQAKVDRVRTLQALHEHNKSPLQRSIDAQQVAVKQEIHRLATTRTPLQQGLNHQQTAVKQQIKERAATSSTP